MLSLRAALLATVVIVAFAAPALAERPSPRIINGDPVSSGYQWTVALVDPGNTQRAFCGGTLIHDQVVLTAAHCVVGTPKSQIMVVAGTPDLTAADPENIVAVTRISVHPLAQADDDAIVPRRDVALLTLAANPPGADPIAIGNEAAVQAAQTSDTAVRVSGWGLTEPAGADTVPVMQSAIIHPVHDADCASTYTGFFGEGVFSAVDQVCAIEDPSPSAPPSNDVKDTCNGDSGGPLVGPTTPTPDPTSAADWQLLGTTSWGLACAMVVDDEAIPGVYARTAGDQLRPYAVQAADGTDTSPEQPQWISGEPQVAGDASGVLCVGNPLEWTPGVDQVDQLIRRRLGPDSYQTVSFTGSYRFDEGDDGDRFVCEVHGRRSDAGGYGVRRSGAVQVQSAPGPQVVQVPVPGPVVTLPAPPPVTQVVPVFQPRLVDHVAPRTDRVTRSCTRRRVCTFTIRTSDAPPSEGVPNVMAVLNTVRTRPCTRRGRRTQCASWRAIILRARPVAGQPGTFRVTPRRLARGSHVLLVNAVDAAGNVQPSPRRVTFRLG